MAGKTITRILGIDPGLAIVGWGVLDFNGLHFRPVAYDSIQTPAGLSVPERLVQIHEELKKIIETFRPDACAIEELFFNTNTTTGIMVGEARGVILLTCRECGVDIMEYTPLQVKQAVVGYGRAEKKQVIQMVTSILNLPAPPKPDDTADALAIAICHAHSGCSRLSAYYNH